MTEKVIFPKNEKQRYYRTHYAFFRTLAEGAGKEIRIQHLPDDGRAFSIIYKGIDVLIDYGDHKGLCLGHEKYPFYFRYHYSKKMHGHLGNCYPLTPISFYDWARYWALEQAVNYTANSALVLNKQKPGKGAKERRERVQKMLKKAYRTNVDMEIDKNKVDFWRRINDCLLAVCIPGARPDILDRGQFQYWAFGACTISPPLDITLPFWMDPKPGQHYIACRPDFSDLIDRIEECRTDREIPLRIGREAKQLFQATSTPSRIWQWINFVLEGK